HVVVADRLHDGELVVGLALGHLVLADAPRVNHAAHGNLALDSFQLLDGGDHFAFSSASSMRVRSSSPISWAVGRWSFGTFFHQARNDASPLRASLRAWSCMATAGAGRGGLLSTACADGSGSRGATTSAVPRI